MVFVVRPLFFIAVTKGRFIPRKTAYSMLTKYLFCGGHSCPLDCLPGRHKSTFKLRQRESFSFWKKDMSPSEREDALAKRLWVARPDAVQPNLMPILNSERPD